MKRSSKGPKGKALPPSHGRSIAAKLARAIDSSGLTPYQVAAKSRVDHRSVGRFMSGERDLHLATAAAIAEALGLELVERKKSARVSGRPADAGEAEAEAEGAGDP